MERFTTVRVAREVVSKLRKLSTVTMAETGELLPLSDVIEYAVDTANKHLTNARKEDQ